MLCITITRVSTPDQSRTLSFRFISDLSKSLGRQKAENYYIYIITKLGKFLIFFFLTRFDYRNEIHIDLIETIEKIKHFNFKLTEEEISQDYLRL